jgi:hypothetical protein
MIKKLFMFLLISFILFPVIAFSQRKKFITEKTQQPAKTMNEKIPINGVNTIPQNNQQSQTVQQTNNFFDTDQDGLDDNMENQLLERFRPYFFFSDDGGEDNFRPTDVLLYLKTSDLHTDGDEDGKYTAIQQKTLFNDPGAILIGNGLYGASDIIVNATISKYRINPNENVPDFNESNPGRHGNTWNEEMQKRNIGLYGHVGIIRIKNPRMFRFDKELPGSNQIMDYYKIEYWQFFGYNSAGKSFDIGDHEGDWTSVQVIYDPRGDSIYAVMHYAHGMEFRFDMNEARSFQKLPVKSAGLLLECKGPNYNRNIDLVSHDLQFNRNEQDYKMTQNNVLRLFQDPVSNRFTHPVVYIEHGTHEFFPSPDWNYYAAPNHNGNSFNFLTNTPPNLGEVEHPLSQDVAMLVILRFNGYWGTYCKANCSPPGPPLHANWAWPASSSIKWLLPQLTY